MYITCVPSHRKQNEDIISSLRAGGFPPKHDIIKKYMVAGQHNNLKDGSPIFLTRPGLCNPAKLMTIATIDEVSTSSYYILYMHGYIHI